MGESNVERTLGLIVDHVRASYEASSWSASDVWLELAHTGSKDDPYDSYVFGYIFGLWRRAAASEPGLANDKKKLSSFLDDYLTGVFGGSEENRGTRAWIAIEDTEQEVGFQGGCSDGDAAAIALLSDRKPSDQLARHLRQRPQWSDR
jgi:hypothetical protein